MEKAEVISGGGTRPATLDEVRPFLELALRFEDSGVMCVDDFSGMKLFACIDGGGAIVGGYALALQSWKLGRVVWIMAAGGMHRRIDFTRSYLPALHKQAEAMGACQVAVLTTRPALQKKLKAAGYEGRGQVLRMKL